MIDRGSVTHRLDPGMCEDLELDVAIVGAGASGLYTGYRLVTGEFEEGRSAPPSVALFDLADRIGGRLHSVELPGLEFYGELGGMRYMTSMGIITTMIEDVFKSELEHVDFSMGDDSTRYFYLRKERFKADAWTNAQKAGKKFLTRYALNDGDVGFSADQLFSKATYDVLMADPAVRAEFGTKLLHPTEYDYEIQLTGEDWDAIKPDLKYCSEGPFEGRAVAELGYWNLLTDQLSQEGLNFLADAGGYYANTINWNAAEAIQQIVGDFFGPVEYRTIKGGFDSVLYALAKALLDAQVKIFKQNGVVGVRPAPEGSPRRYELKIANQQLGREWLVYADAVVLAMPRRSLELLGSYPSYLSLYDGPEGATFRQAVSSTIIQQSMKILMGFEKPWWKEDFGATAGESVTDLPMRQCYYFGTNQHDSHSLFLSSYNDIDTVSYWSALEQDEPFEPHATRLVSQADVDAISEYQAPKVMIAESMAQVRELHGLPNIPEPYVTWYKDWSHEPFGGGYHAWFPNISVRDVMRYMRKPRADEAIHVVGEAYSDQQGWAEGAFCVAELLLCEEFGMKRWSRIPKDYYLGW